MTTEPYSLKFPSAGPTTGHGKTDTEAQRSETEKPDSSACAVGHEGEQGMERTGKRDGRKSQQMPKPQRVSVTAVASSEVTYSFPPH